MGRVAVTLELDGPLPVAERLWYELDRWVGWVEGFGHVVSVQGPWPETGARVVWDSRPSGRGRVVERVVEHRPREGQTVEVEDETLRGRQRVAFAPAGAGVAVTLELDYEVKRAGVGRPLLDRFFIRRALGDSLRRTLVRFGRELRTEAELLR